MRTLSRLISLAWSCLWSSRFENDYRIIISLEILIFIFFLFSSLIWFRKQPVKTDVNECLFELIYSIEEDIYFFKIHDGTFLTNKLFKENSEISSLQAQ